MLASVHEPEDIKAARKAGYAAAITVKKFGKLPGVVPCLEQTVGTPCVECRHCLNDRSLSKAIAFKVRGKAAREALSATAR